MIRKLSLLVMTGFVLVVGIWACQSSSPSSPSTVDDPGPLTPNIMLMTKLNKFITVDDDSMFVFDRIAASAAGFDSHELELGQTIASAATDVLRNRESSTTLMDKLVPTFEAIAEEIESANSDESGNVGKAATPQTHCPPRYGISTADAKGWLRSRGYHQVSSYATGAYGRDFAKFVTTSHYPASFSPFWTYRNQGLAASDNRSIMLQDVEPNPELSSYPWPVWPGAWWGPYVTWWHLYYC